MFQKKEYIFSETLGVCRVEDVNRLSANKGDGTNYYLLRSVYDREKIAYIPVEHHSVQLRCLCDKERAEQMTEEAYHSLPLIKQQEIAFVRKQNKIAPFMEKESDE